MAFGGGTDGIITIISLQGINLNSSIWHITAFIYIVSLKIKEQLDHGLFSEYLQLNFMICVCGNVDLFR